jgi:SAM-dependent methyltransferase
MARLALLIALIGLFLAGCHGDHVDAPSLLPAQDNPSTDGASRPAALFVEFVATPQDVVERMLKMAGVTKNDVVYDLGCGDGRIVVTAARRYGCRAVGYDIDPLRLQEARANVARRHVGHLVTLEQKDILHVDLQGASVVTLYLGTEINARLIPQLKKLRPGARIVSHDFPIGALKPDKIVEMISHADGNKHVLYLWTCPLPSDRP